MSELFWASVCRFLVDHPALLDRMLERAKRTPYTYIQNLDGSLYMERWWLVGPKSAWRFVLPLMRFHLIHTADLDRNPHSHPWAFRSLILRGGYTERRHLPSDGPSGSAGPLVGTMVFRRNAGFSYRMGLGDYHRISDVQGPVLTLVILGRRVRSWGFLVDGQFVRWTEYLGLPADAASGTQGTPGA